MAAFDPATLAMQRENLRRTASDLDRDRRLLNRQPKNSKSKMSERLRERIATGTSMIRDLERLIAFMEGVNATYIEHVDHDEAAAVREIREEMALEAAGVEHWEDL